MARALPGTRSLDETLKACPTCWMCRNICPVGNVTGREVDTTRGFALIADGVLRNELEPSDDVVEVLDRCVDCRQCTNWCVSGYTPWKAVQAARAALVARGAIAARSETYPRTNGSETGETLLLVSEAPAPFEAAALKLLRRALPDVAVLRGGTGYRSWVLGSIQYATEELSQTLDAVRRSGCRTLAVLSPTDARALLDPPEELAAEIDARVRVVELIDLLAELGVPQPRAAPMSVAYHDACSAQRGSGREARARQLLQILPGIKMVEMPWPGDRVQSCGQGGGLPSTRGALAARLAHARLTEAREAGAEAIVVDAPECAAHLARHAMGTGVRVISLHELLAEAEEAP